MKLWLIISLSVAIYSCATLPQSHTAGQPWMSKVQQIPGIVECELYNQGGEGIAYHDADSINNGSGKLNPANGNFLNEFRMKEGVDISYTKSNDIDNSPYNKVAPVMNQLYVGWTEPGEWIKYTVNVATTGTYIIDLMYTANVDGAISLDIDGQEATSKLKVISTYDSNEPVKWRQWHHWNKAVALGQIQLKKGIHILTLRTIDKGNMNYDYLAFRKL